MVSFRSAYTYFMLPWGTDCLDYWLGINHEYAIGILRSPFWSDYFTGLLESMGPSTAMDSKWII
jgi:hypothetical protein